MKTKQKPRKEKALSVFLEVELLDQFTLICDLKRVTIKSQMEEVMKDFVKRESAAACQNVFQQLNIAQ